MASMDDSYWSRNKAPDWLTATEFQDTDFCLDEKLDILVKLLKCSRYLINDSKPQESETKIIDNGLKQRRPGIMFSHCRNQNCLKSIV